MDVRIVDTTLKDRELSAGAVVGALKKARIAKLLDSIGVYQIEAGVAALGTEEIKGIRRISDLGLKSKISVWSRLDMGDIEKAGECRPDIVSISVPASNARIENSPGKTRGWVLENLRRCVARCVEKELAVTVGLEDAPKADMPFLLILAAAAFSEGAKTIRYYDLEGITDRRRIFESIAAVKAAVPAEIEMSARNRLGMAVANSIAAVRAGAGRVDCSAAGPGGKGGNCSLLDFIKSARACLGLCGGFDLRMVKDARTEIARIIQ